MDKDEGRVVLTSIGFGAGVTEKVVALLKKDSCFGREREVFIWHSS